MLVHEFLSICLSTSTGYKSVCLMQGRMVDNIVKDQTNNRLIVRGAGAAQPVWLGGWFQ